MPPVKAAEPDPDDFGKLVWLHFGRGGHWGPKVTVGQRSPGGDVPSEL
jgi:hypothetical protein